MGEMGRYKKPDKSPKPTSTPDPSPSWVSMRNIFRDGKIIEYR
jgi:hypothetical protein